MLKKIIVALLLLIALFVGVGFALPARITVERALLIKAAPEIVFGHVSQLKSWPEWTVWNTAKYPKIVYRYEGPEQGVGATSIWTDPDNGDGRLVVTAHEPNRRMAFDFFFADYPKNEGAIELSPATDGVQVRWYFGCDMGGNLIGRYFGLFMDGMAGPELEANLQNLAARCH